MKTHMDDLQIGSWPSSRALYGMDVMLSLPEQSTPAGKQSRGTASAPTASQHLPSSASECAPLGSQDESGPDLVSAQLEKSRLEGSALLQSARGDDSSNVEGSSSSTADTCDTDNAAAGKLPADGSRSEAALDASCGDGSGNSNDNSSGSRGGNDSSNNVTAGNGGQGSTSVASPSSSSSAGQKQQQLRRAQPQLLEVNSSPDFSLVAKQWPNFLNDAFTVLFLPHQKLPESFVAV